MNPEIEKIFSHFSSDFNATYLYMTGKQKKEIAYLSSTIFTRWYYSALFPETILSPAVIYNSQKENFILNKGFYSANVHFKNVSSDTLNFSYKENFYSIEDHPIYKDIVIFLEYMDPLLYIDSDGNMFEKDIRILQKKLSISDRYYVLYLFDLTERLNLFNPMASLFDNCVQPNYENVFLKLPNSKKLDRIIDESCNICADSINTEIPFGFCELTPENIYDFLEKPKSIDDIFIILYQNSDIDIEEIWNRSDSEKLSESDSAILSSILYIGIYFDKSFVYIFGNYLRLIQPIYSFPIKFREIINALFTSISIDGERETEIFIPCTTYSHSLLGKIIFKTNTNENKNLPQIPVDKITKSLNKEYAARKTAIECLELSKETNSIFTFKAILNKNKTLWKKIEIEKNTALNTVARHTYLMFMLPEENEFSIRINNNGKEAAQYIGSPKNILYSSVSTKIGDVIPSIGKSIVLKFGGNSTIELIFKGSKDMCSEILYPRIIEQSKELTVLEHKTYTLDFLN